MARKTREAVRKRKELTVSIVAYRPTESSADPRDEELTVPPSARLSRLTPRAPTTLTT
jgi:hypothetical protein